MPHENYSRSKTHEYAKNLTDKGNLDISQGIC